MKFLLLALLLLPSDYFECENKCAAKRHRCELRCSDVGSVEHARCYQRCRETFMNCLKKRA